MAETKSRTAIPPLQPLSIAPKPTKNVPIAIKPVTTQQLLLVQGIGTRNRHFAYLIVLLI